MKLKELQRENSLQRLRINRMKNDRVKLVKEKLTQKVQMQKEETGSYHLDGHIEKEVTRASFHEDQLKDNIFEKGKPFMNEETFRKQTINEPTDNFEFPSIGTVSHICTLSVVMYVIVRLTKVQRTVMIYQMEIRRINQAVTQCQSELENIRQKLYDVTTAQSAMETPETVKITVVSFQGGSAQTSHKQMAESVINRKEIKELLDEGGGTWDVKQVLVNTVSDVEKIVASRFILIFIDHNDATKILEDPNSKIEKVKSKTVESAIKMSDTVIIVYCWDTKSKDLDLGTLYSPRLENSLSHPLLLELRKQQSIYSIYKSFTHFQRCHLIKKLQSILKDHSKEIVLAPPKQNLHVQTSTSLYVR